MALRDQPYLPLYINDFLTDEKLTECSAESTGVYIRLMCIMHKSEEYGKILLKQKDKQTDNQIKNFALKMLKHLPYSEEIIMRSLTELIEEDVLTISEDTLFQKRMVKDSELSYKRALSGKKGGNPLNKNKNFAYPNLQANTESENEYNSLNSQEIGGMGEKTENGSEAPNAENHDTKSEETFGEVLDELSFENVWAMYGRKGNKKTSEKKWGKLENHCKLAALKHIPEYVKATADDIQYRKNFETYINQEAWNDEIFAKNGKNVSDTNTKGNSGFELETPKDYSERF